MGGRLGASTATHPLQAVCERASTAPWSGCRRCGARPRRRVHAGPDPQPARRPGDPGQERRARSVAVVLAIASSGHPHPHRLCLVRVAGAAVPAVFLVHAIAGPGPGRCDPGEARAGRRSAGRRHARVGDHRPVLTTKASALDEFRFWQVGSIAGRERGGRRAGAGRSCWSAPCSCCPAPRARRARARRRRRPKGLGRRGGATVAHRRRSPATVLTGAGVAARPGRSPSSASRAARRPRDRRARPLAGCCRARASSPCSARPDIVGRVLLPPGEVQAGVMTAADRRAVPGRAGPGRPASSAREHADRERTPDRLAGRSSASPGAAAPTGAAALVASASASCGGGPRRLGAARRDHRRARRRRAGPRRAAIPGASCRRSSRLPRAVVGLLVGAAFGLGGALIQTVARNPLASPDIIGISQGASAVAVGAMVFARPRHRSCRLVSVVGGALAVALVVRAGAGGLHAAPVRARRDRLRGALGGDRLLTRGDTWSPSGAIWMTGSSTAAAGEPPPLGSPCSSCCRPSLWRGRTQRHRARRRHRDGAGRRRARTAVRLVAVVLAASRRPRRGRSTSWRLAAADRPGMTRTAQIPLLCSAVLVVVVVLRICWPQAASPPPSCRSACVTARSAPRT